MLTVHIIVIRNDVGYCVVLIRDEWLYCSQLQFARYVLLLIARCRVEFVRINRFLSLLVLLADVIHRYSDTRAIVKFGPEDFDRIPTSVRKRK